MPLPHFSNIASHNQVWEPVYKNLYEVVIILPPAIQALHPGYETILLENTTQVKFPTYPDIASTPQRFKYSTRLFLTFPESTSVTDLAIQFNMNVNDNYQVMTWRMMKDWYDLVWNNEDGSVHYKKNIISDIVVHAHDKEGHVIRRVTYHNAQLNGITGWEELDWSTTDLQVLSTKFVADYWEDMYY